MSAVRLARAFTGRDKILKFEGCYHGHADSFLIKAGSGLLTAGVPTSPGIPRDYAQNTLVAEYNNLDSLQTVFEEWGPDIAAVIVEPIAGNMGLIVPDTVFLMELRKITEDYGTLLIFDEVISGFRTCYGAYQNLIDIKPDLTTLGKIIREDAAGFAEAPISWNGIPSGDVSGGKFYPVIHWPWPAWSP